MVADGCVGVIRPFQKDWLFIALFFPGAAGEIKGEVAQVFGNMDMLFYVICCFCFLQKLLFLDVSL